MKMLKRALQCFRKNSRMIKLCSMCASPPTYCILSATAKKLSSCTSAITGSMRNDVITKEHHRQIAAFHTDYMGKQQGSFREHEHRTTESSEGKPAHVPVMVDTVLDILQPQNNQVIVDMTFGNGGHTQRILQVAPEAEIICLDRDPLAYSIAQKMAKSYRPGQIRPFNGKFTDLPEFLHRCDIMPGTVDSFLFDVGVSSMQFDEAVRGFSLSKDGPLDMRMDQARSLTQISPLVVQGP